VSKNAMSSGQARSIKLSGDRLRKYFYDQCTDSNGHIEKGNLIGLNNKNLEGTYVLKSGKNWQFHLGNFSPYTKKWGVHFLNQGKIVKYQLDNEDIIFDFRNEVFLRTFMLKGNFFVVYDTTDWLIFDSQDIIDLMQNSNIVKWRILDSGRVKGDFYKNDTKRTVFTLEFRAEKHKKQFVFGAHGGGAGERLKYYLKEYLFYTSIPVAYEHWK
jgi:hypothetical protein